MSKKLPHVVEVETDLGGGFRYEPGYVGAFTRNQAKGAWPNGSRVEKIKEEKGDHHEIGERAVILGSMFDPQQPLAGIMYFIEWDRSPGMAIACLAWKLRSVNDKH